MHTVGFVSPWGAAPHTTGFVSVTAVVARAGRAWEKSASCPRDGSFQSLGTREAGGCWLPASFLSHQLGSQSKLMPLVRQI